MKYDAVMAETRLTTAEELLAMGEGRRELIRGRVVELTPPGFRHGRIGGNVFAFLWIHIRDNGLDLICGTETGFLLERGPDLVRAPDVAVVAAERIEGIDERKYAPLAPDLAVEVVSPSDRFRDVEEKAAMWLAHGSRLVWVIEPDLRKAFVYRPGMPREEIPESGELAGEDVLPGLAIPLAECL